MTTDDPPKQNEGGGQKAAYRALEALGRVLVNPCTDPNRNKRVFLSPQRQFHMFECEESEAEEDLGDWGRPDGKRQRISEQDDGQNHQTGHSKEGNPSNQNRDEPMKDEEVDNGQYHQGEGTLLSPHVQKTEKTKQGLAGAAAALEQLEHLQTDMSNLLVRFAVRMQQTVTLVEQYVQKTRVELDKEVKSVNQEIHKQLASNNAAEIRLNNAQSTLKLNRSALDIILKVVNSYPG